jgi:glycosyltransferase involved in cell wall biosynthesis
MQVTLITCTWNSKKTIKNCYLSILDKTYDDIEHIIIDKTSDDKTLSTSKKYKIKNQKIFFRKISMRLDAPLIQQYLLKEIY